VDPSTNLVRWKKRMPYSLAHGNGILSTASDLLFIGQPDGNLLALDAHGGRELWRFQTGAAISSSPIMYEVDGEQYVAVYAGGTSIPYGDSAPRGDYLWAFKLGGTLAPAPTPTPPVVRRPVSGGPVEGSAVNNTVVLARTYDPATGQVGTTESTAVNAMAPTHLRVPVGTTVTFVNPAGNVNTHGATQFFEGLFDVRLAPGESFSYTFRRAGEYFFNDSFSPRPTGKVVVH
jgi:outer membrane protein assembly factor BamB